MKKYLKFAFLMVMGAILVVGCGNKHEVEKNKRPTPNITAGAPSVTSIPSGTVTPTPAFTGVTLNWCLPGLFSETALKEKADAMNTVLDRLGREYHIAFSMADFMNYPSSITQYGVDIASFGSEDYWNTVESGCFLPLDEWLNGTELYKHYSAKLWEAVRIDGNIYSVPALGGTCMDGPLFVFNRKYFTEEQVDGLSLSLEALESVLQELKEQKVSCPLYFHVDPETMLSTFGSYVRRSIVYSPTNGINALTDDSTYWNVVDILHRYAMDGLVKGPAMKSNGYITGGLKELRTAYEALGEDSSAVEWNEGLDFGILISSSRKDFSGENVLVRRAPHVLGWTPLNWSAGVWSTSKNPELAFAFLMDFYTNIELQGMFFDPLGEDDESMSSVERFEKHLVDTSFIGTREALIGESDELNTSVDEWFMEFAYQKVVPNGVMDMETSGILSGLCSDYANIWELPEYEYFKSQLRQKMKEANIDAYVEKARDQYEQWNKQ